MELVYKKEYTQEEYDELVAWLRKVEYKGTLVLDMGLTITNMEMAINNMILQTEAHVGNPNFSGQIHKMFLIRKRLIEEGHAPEVWPS